MSSTFWGESVRKASVYILKPFRVKGQRLEESLWGAELVKNLVIFWMNNKTIILSNLAFVWCEDLFLNKPKPYETRQAKVVHCFVG